MFHKISSVVKSAEYATPQQFLLSQWQKSGSIRISYIVYRLLIAMIFSIMLVIAVLDLNNENRTVVSYFKFFIYLTHWTFILCTIQAWMAAYIVLTQYLRLKNYNDQECSKILNELEMSRLYKVYSRAYTMSIVCSIAVTVVFWLQVYVPSYHHLGIMTYVLHGLNSVLMIADILIVAHPMVFSHFRWTLGFVIIYFTFSYVYFLCGGTNKKDDGFIYHSLNWQHPKNALLFCVGCLASGFIIHTTAWLLSISVRHLSSASHP